MRRLLLAALVAALVMGSVARGGTVLTFEATHKASTEYTLSARAEFLQIGNLVTLQLSNLAMGNVQYIDQLLTGVFWDGALVLSELSVSGESGFRAPVNGPIIELDTRDVSAFTATGVPGGWLSGYWPGGGALAQDFGVGTVAAMGFFPATGYIDYGLTTLNDEPQSNSALLTNVPLIRRSVTFTFQIRDGFTISPDIINTVRFQYGDQVTDHHLNGELVRYEPPAPSVVPEPSTFILGLLGLIGLAGLRHHRRIH